MRKLGGILLVLLVSSVMTGCTWLDKNNKAGLQILTNDVGAAVFLGEQYLDKTPYINKELKPGQYLLKIVPDDSSFVPYETTINLRRGLLTVVTWKPGQRPELSGGVVYELEKLPNKGQTEVSIVSIPDGAVVSFDEGDKDFSPVLSTDVQPGTHEISVSLPSYETQQHTVNVVAGHRLNILVKLAKNPVGEEETASQAAQVVSATLSAQLSPAVLATTSTTTTPLSGSLVTAPTEPSVPTSLKQPTALTSPPPKPRVTVLSTNFYQEGKEVLRVRDAIGIGGKELGFAPVGSMYPYLNETSQGWHKISFEGKAGWVSGQYTKLEK